jgi:hypothetical protein
MLVAAILPFAALFCSAGGLCPSDQEQSLSSSDAVQEALQDIGIKKDSGLKDAARIYAWLRRPGNFDTKATGGSEVGKSTLQSILSSKKLTGCHDWGLAVSGLLAAAGYRASLVDGVSVKGWKEKREGANNGYVGHIFVDADLDGRRVLLNSTEPRYLEGYDPESPVIPMSHYDSSLFYVLDKGADPASYSTPIHSNSELQKRMDTLALSADLENLPKTKGPGTDLPPVPGAQPILCDSAFAARTQPDRSRRGVVLQYRQAGLDVYIAKGSGKYALLRYPYGRVFKEQEPAVLFFDTRQNLKQYLRTLGSPD